MASQRCTRLLKRQFRQYSSVSDSQRSKNISFIGLGRMGFEMAYNLFSKTLKETSDSHFIVCDAIPDCAQSFRDKFLAQFPGAHVDAVMTLEEYVQMLTFSLAFNLIMINREQGQFWHPRLSSPCFRLLHRSKPCILNQVA